MSSCRPVANSNMPRKNKTKDEINVIQFQQMTTAEQHIFCLAVAWNQLRGLTVTGNEMAMRQECVVVAYLLGWKIDLPEARCMVN